MTPYKIDCFYYTEVRDMGACISQCKRYSQLGKCPCDNCTDYISNKEVCLVIKDYVRNKKWKKEPETDILDKIMAEIIQVADDEEVHDEKWALGLRYAVNIIDKYKAESEVRDERIKS